MEDKTIYTMDFSWKTPTGRNRKPFKYYINKEGCFITTLTHNDGGYPFSYNEKGIVTKLSIISYRQHHGDIINNNHVMHSCDNIRCFNPAHLSQGTNGDNRNDSKEKGRLKKAGHKRLNKEKVNEIIENNYKSSAKKLSLIYGVTTRSIELVRQKHRTAMRLLGLEHTLNVKV